MRGWFTNFLLGWALAAVAVLQVLFALLALFLAEPWLAFLTSGLITAVPALALLSRTGARTEPSRRGSLLAILLLWLLVPISGALPFLLGNQLGPLDSLFESMSGFTTMGASVLGDLRTVPESLLLWRSFSQWLGGIGIIVVFAAIFPQLGIAGRQLFTGEEPGPREDRLAPRLRHAALALLGVYGGLSAVAFLSFWLAGMDVLQALMHAFSTLSAGGFTASMDAGTVFEQPVFAFILILFMLLAGTNFALQYRAYAGHPGEFFRDAEFRAYLVVIIAAAAVLLLLLGTGGSIMGALLQVVSVISTTGFTVESLAEWPRSAKFTLMALMFVGGSAGSAAGGIRIMRWLTLLSSAGKELQHILHPRAALPLKVGHRLISPDVMRSTATFFTLYVLLALFSSGGFILLGHGLETGISASLSAVGLVGFAFAGDGQLLDFAALDPLAKAILIFDMYAGRLEIVTLAVLLLPGFWRRPRNHARQGARQSTSSRS